MRSLWTGAINFGLVNIPVRLYTATEDSSLGFKMLHKDDLSEVGYAKKCKAEGKEISSDEIVKGYKLSSDEYIVLTDADFAKADQEKTKSIEIVRFTDVDEVDSIYFEKPYYIEPEKGGDKPYALLRAALKKSRRVGIAKVVMKNQEHLALIKVNSDGVLVLNMMRFHEEIRNTGELKIPSDENVGEKELGLALHLIDVLTEKFNPEEFRDTYKEELMRVIEEKAAGRKPTSHGVAPKASNVSDIMALLKESLDNTGKKAKTSTSKSLKAVESDKDVKPRRRKKVG